MAPVQAMSNPALAGRIQGFGNVNPPPVEENAKSVARRIAGNLGDMLSEEVKLTVDDFKEKGAVGAVKDAVADAGDILIDGVAGVFSWIRGDPPQQEEEDESEKAQKAQQVLAQGPSGAAYGISQASPTGGINAVWVMPEEADPATLAEVAKQRAPSNIQPYAPQNPMAIPGGPTIQPYQPRSSGPSIAPYQPQAPMMIPGGPTIQPYMPTGPGQRPAPFNPAGFQQAAPAFGLPSSGPSGGSARTLVEQIAKGETIVGPQVAKRLIEQCRIAKLTAKQLGEMICERGRRLYLGLDSSCQDSDAAILRILGLMDAFAAQDNDLAKATVQVVKDGIKEELTSLQSSMKHKSAAEPMLKRIGLIAKMPEPVDLLGAEAAEPVPAASASVDLLDFSVGAPAPNASASLL